MKHFQDADFFHYDQTRYPSTARTSNHQFFGQYVVYRKLFNVYDLLVPALSTVSHPIPLFAFFNTHLNGSITWVERLLFNTASQCFIVVNEWYDSPTIERSSFLIFVGLKPFKRKYIYKFIAFMPPWNLKKYVLEGCYFSFKYFFFQTSTAIYISC